MENKGIFHAPMHVSNTIHHKRLCRRQQAKKIHKSTQPVAAIRNICEIKKKEENPPHLSKKNFNHVWQHNKRNVIRWENFFVSCHSHFIRPIKRYHSIFHFKWQSFSVASTQFHDLLHNNHNNKNTVLKFEYSVECYVCSVLNHEIMIFFS